MQKAHFSGQKIRQISSHRAIVLIYVDTKSSICFFQKFFFKIREKGTFLEADLVSRIFAKFEHDQLMTLSRDNPRQYQHILYLFVTTHSLIITNYALLLLNF